MTRAKPEHSEQVPEVVEQHQADRDADHPHVEHGKEPWPADVNPRRRIVNTGLGQFRGNTGMALAASLLQVVRVDRRSRVGVRQDFVAAVTRCAVGDVDIARFALETMVGINEGFEPSGRYSVAFVQRGGLVTGGTGGLCQPCSADRRTQVGRRKNAVLAVAMSAHRCSDLTAPGQLTVDALPIVPPSSRGGIFRTYSGC